MDHINGSLTGCSLSVEQHHRLIAREVVRSALSAACSRLELNAGGLQLFSGCSEVEVGLRINNLSNSMEVEGGGEEGRRDAEKEEEDYMEGGKWRGPMEKYLTPKKGSSVGESRVTFELPHLANAVKFASDEESPSLRRRVLTGSWGHSNTEMVNVDEQEVRSLAKKLVRAVLRAACKQWESLDRRSSIEYLIASTKRMRIGGSPTPPLLVVESPTSEKAPGPQPAVDHDDISSMLSSRGRKKRGRSESHDVFFMKELERFRESHLGQQKEELNNFCLSASSCRRVASKGKSDSYVHPTRLSPKPSIGDLTSTIERMSIADEADCGDEDEYLIISAVTKNLDLDTDDQRAHYSPEYQNVPPSSPGQASKYSTDSNIEGNGCVSLPRRVHYARLEVPQNLTSHSSKPTRQAATYVQNMDLFIIIHSYPKPGQCQKFLCNNTNELNLIYHCWLYPDIPFDPSVTVTDKVEMGIFCPQGVQPVHLDLVDGGIPFLYLDKRWVYM